MSNERNTKIRLMRESKQLLAIDYLSFHGCKPIPEYPMYWVTPWGKVFSLYGRKVQELKPGTKAGGYNFVGLYGKDGTAYHMIHRIVASAFIPNLGNLPEVNHKDGDKKNNHVNNLEWCTRQQNSEHAVRLGLYKSGSKHPHSILTADQVRAIRSDTNGSYRVIGKRYGCSAQTVCNVKRRSKYADVP